MRNFLNVNLQLFDLAVGTGGTNTSNGIVYNATGNTTGTTGNDLSVQQGKFYSKYMLQNARAELVHNQFGQKQPIPKGNGKVISFRGMDPYPLATTPLTEGVTPKGNQMNMRNVVGEVKQYGAYTPMTDMLSLTAMDDMALLDTEELGSQAGRTLDVITREVINGGTCVMYAPIIATDGTETPVTARSSLTKNAKFTVDCVLRAARFLKTQNAPKIDGYYVAIVHPDVEYDVISSQGFKELVKYTDNVKRVFAGEIGAIGSVRFVVSSEAKVFVGAGASGIDVYSTLVIGANAYGVTEINGGGLQHIVKPLGSAGAADPLDQRATRGWKATATAVRLTEQFMIRVESASTFS